MGRRTTLAVLVAAATIPFTWNEDSSEEMRSFDATFVQIGPDQRGYDEAHWRAELTVLDDLGIDLIILQFSGDEHGSYDRPERTPVAALLAAAHTFDMRVLIGLHDDPTWPSDASARRPAPPLNDPAAASALGQLCERAPACAGWYIPQEVDDATWFGPERSALLREHLSRTAGALHELAPNKSIAIAPFATGTLGPQEHAAWWRSVLPPGGIDILILQDGVGTGRATPELAGIYLSALGPELAPAGIELWSVAELFKQVHGPPIDSEPFAAVPIDPATLRHSLAIESALVEHVVAFAVLDYMDPRRGGASRRLHDAYAIGCRIARTSRRKPC